ncbi:MAG: class I poly(R)-hydroxyalkanoic acid synthase [Pseudomonadota bacterium]|nr:class I poly(R)-hydroxyalkanoic acid synthase [Pseudomonadota bacterium]
MATLPLDPTALTALQAEYLGEAAALWNRCWQQPGGLLAAKDRRFAAADWAADPAAAFSAELHLLNSRTLMKLAEQVQTDAKTRARLRFAALQVADATAPSNFLALNPEAQKKAIASGGESVTQGMRQLWDDLQRGHLSQTDESAFEVGRNVATSEGAVVFENELFQLLEYKPLTPQVFARPLLIVPPCINKYYILDLQPENSLIRFCVAGGHRTFVVSWKNAERDIAQATWDDYIDKAVLRAIALVQEIGASKQINTLGFCIGGTLLATALAVLAARGERPAASVTLLTTFLDFSDTGILDIFIDEAGVRLREMTLGSESPGGGSLLKGQELATTFSFLRPNDLVWNYVVGNYLKGEKPPPFDLLYWNGDGTNLPGPMYCWYLRNTYLENNLVKPGRLTVCGEKVDLGKIDIPAYVYGSREDHIVPWQGSYQSTQILGGDCRYVLGASGHIAGVINPPLKKKRSHWIGKGNKLPADGEAWLAAAEERPGSWWDDWAAWLRPFGGGPIPAPKRYGDRERKPIEPAPGRYVKEKA